MKNINDIMNNNQNMYYGHGTNGNHEVINSIFVNGLRCSHGSLYFTSCNLGIGGKLSDDINQMFDNWPHLNASNIVVVSLPYKYNILEIAGTETYEQGTAAYYYIPNEDQQNKYNLTNSPYVRPEFILGCYDSNNKNFNHNPNYYENLSIDKQKEILNNVKEKYMYIIDDAIGLREYKEIMKELPNWQFPLSDDDIENFLNRKMNNHENKSK